MIWSLAAMSSPVFSAAFQDLDFDSATTNITVALPPDQGAGYGPASDLLPGWQLLQGTNPVSLVGLDLNPISLGVASIYDGNSQGFPAPVLGEFSLGLFPGYNLIFDYQPFSLLQTGDIGANIRSIRFLNYGSPFTLTVNGAPISLAYEYQPGSLDPDTRQAIVTGDISAFAGQTVQLKLTTMDIPGSTVNGLDNIEFSTQIVPEPCVMTLLFAGLVIWGLRFRLQSRPGPNHRLRF